MVFLRISNLVRSVQIVLLLVVLVQWNSSPVEAWVTQTVAAPGRINSGHFTLWRRKGANDELPLEQFAVFNKTPDNVEQSKEDTSAVWIARATLLTVSAFYGTNFGCVKIIEEALDPSVAAVMRFTLASMVFSPYLLKYAATGISESTKQLVMGGLEVGLYTSLGYFGQSQALMTTDATTAAFICSLAVIVVPILEATFGKETTQNEKMGLFLPAMMATAGVACLELGGSTLPGSGDLWALLQPLFFGLSFWRIEHHMKLATKPGETQAFTGAILLFVAVFSVVWASYDWALPLLSGSDGSYAKLTSSLQTQLAALQNIKVAASILWTGVVTTALTAFFENIAMKKLDAVESTVIYSTEPLWGAVFAAATLGEKIGSNTVMGAVLIMGACVFRSVDFTALIGAVAGATLQTEGLEDITDTIGENIETIISIKTFTNTTNLLE